MLAVSGGVDSVVMAHLFREAGLSFGIAHVNFELREEAGKDEAFVMAFAKRMGVPYHAKHFQVHEVQWEIGGSVQEAARSLRYEWFNEVVEREGYQHIATAHHQDDEVETFFINLIRKTGLAGLTGIPVEKGKVIRPLLFTTKKAIEAFAKERKLSYREDQSNFSPDPYLRNKIRLDILPHFDELDRNFRKVLIEDIRNFREVHQALSHHLDDVRERILIRGEGRDLLPVAEVLSLQPASYYMYELLRPYGFNRATTDDIMDRWEKQPGGVYYSPDYEAFRDRQYLILRLRSEASFKLRRTVTIEEDTPGITFPLQMEFETTSWKAGSSLPREANIAYLDHRELHFPLLIRPWKEGDRIRPLGMGGRSQKISDLLTHAKIPLPDKSRVFVLLSGEEVVWVIGLRLSETFKVTEDTERVLKVSARREDIPHPL